MLVVGKIPQSEYFPNISRVRDRGDKKMDVAKKAEALVNGARGSVYARNIQEIHEIDRIVKTLGHTAGATGIGQNSGGYSVRLND
jgi:hypothetical protein